MAGRDPGLEAFVSALPKAELHVHLEGSMGPELLLALARRHDVTLPADDVAGLRRWFRFRDFPHFLEVYLLCSSCLRQPEDFERLLLDFARRQAAQNVVYSEVHFTISTHLTNGGDGDEIAQALGEGMAMAERDFGTVVRLIPDIVRNIGPSAADATLEWALAHRRRGVVALGIAGMEGPPVAPFGRHFEAARQAGLQTTAHAGEQLGPESIRETLDVCRPQRLGHGIAAVREPALLAELVSAGLPFEVCPTSNVRLGYVESLSSHPFDRLHRAGAALSINSDDPPLFGTSLTTEYLQLATAFGYSRAELAGFARAAFEHAFLGSEERQRYLRGFDRHVERSGLDSP